MLCSKCGHSTKSRGCCFFHLREYEKSVGPRKEWKHVYCKLVNAWSYIRLKQRGCKIGCSPVFRNLWQGIGCSHVTDSNIRKNMFIDSKTKEEDKYVYSQAKMRKLQERANDELYTLLLNYKSAELADLELILITIRRYLMNYSKEVALQFCNYLIGRFSALENSEEEIEDPLPISRRERYAALQQREQQRIQLEQQRQQLYQEFVPIVARNTTKMSPFRNENEFIEFITYCINISNSPIVNDIQNQSKWEIFKILDAENSKNIRKEYHTRKQDLTPFVIINDANKLKDRISYLAAQITLIISTQLMDHNHHLLHVFQEKYSIPHTPMLLQSYFVMLWLQDKSPVSSIIELVKLINATINCDYQNDNLLHYLRVLQFSIGIVSIDDLLLEYPNFIIDCWSVMKVALQKSNTKRDISIAILSTFTCISEIISRVRNKESSKSQNLIPDQREIYLFLDLIYSIPHPASEQADLIREIENYLQEGNYRIPCKAHHFSETVTTKVGLIRLQTSFVLSTSFVNNFKFRFLCDMIPNLLNILTQVENHPIKSLLLKDQTNWTVRRISTTWEANSIALSQKRNQKIKTMNRKLEQDAKNNRNLSSIFRSKSPNEIAPTKSMIPVTNFIYDPDASKEDSIIDTRKKPKRRSKKWKKHKNRQTRSEIRSEFSIDKLRYFDYFVREHELPSKFKYGSKQDLWRTTKKGREL